MPEMLDYSSVMAVYGFWLAARSHGLGAGWVSILNPQAACLDHDLPEDWRLITYLCVGYPAEPNDRKRVVEGQRVSARVDPGCLPSLKQTRDTRVIARVP